MEPKPTLGFLGLGIMGTAMVHNLLKSGYNVTVWNRSPDKCQPLVDSGATYASLITDSLNVVGRSRDSVVSELLPELSQNFSLTFATILLLRQHSAVQMNALFLYTTDDTPAVPSSPLQSSTHASCSRCQM